MKKLYINNWHIPYSFDLCRGLDSAKYQIFHSGWNSVFRPYLDYVTIFKGPAVWTMHWDIFITDKLSDIVSVHADKIIFIAHCENNGDPPDDLVKTLALCNAIVTPSENKTASWRFLPDQQNFITIPLSVSVEEYPAADLTSSIVGTAWNGLTLNHDAHALFRTATDSFETKVIGFANDSGKGFEVAKNWDDYRAKLRTLSVFVHPMPGNVCGFSPREALASGIPVVSTYVPELAQLALNGWNIYLCRNSTEMRNAIAKLLADYEHRKTMGRAGRSAVNRVYPLTQFQQMWRDLLDSL